MKKTTIYLVRHGEVENPNHVIYGRLPRFGLSQRGRYQAEKIGEWFSKKNISCIYSSPLLRARKTAECISNGKLPISIKEDINEADYKKWEGIRADQRNVLDVESYIKNPDKLILGESLSHIEKRMRKAVLNAVNKNRGGSAIIVSHADPILVTRLSFEGKPLSEINRYGIKNASITTLYFDEDDNFIKSEYNELVDAKKDLP